MGSDKGKNEEKNTSQKEIKMPTNIDSQMLASLLQSVNQNLQLDNRMNDEDQEDDDDKQSNGNNKEKSQDGDNEEIGGEEMNQNQFMQALIQQYQQTLLQQSQQQQQQQQQQNQQGGTAKDQNHQMEEEENEEGGDEEDEEEEGGQQSNNRNNQNGDGEQGQQQDFAQGLHQQQLLSLLMNINQQQNIPFSQLQQQAMNLNNSQRGTIPSQGHIQAQNRISQQEEDDEEEENEEDDENQQQNLQQMNASNLEQLRIKRLLQNQQAQFLNGEEEEDIEEQIRGIHQLQNNRLKNQTEDMRQQQGIQGNQFEGEEEEDEEEEEEAKQAMHKQFLDKQYRAYISQQQQQFELLMNEVKIIEQYMQNNTITQEQRSFAEQKHQMLIVKLKQLQQHIQEIGMNPNIILEQLQHNQMVQMQKGLLNDQENVLNSQKKEFLSRNNQFIRGSEQIGRNMQMMQDQEMQQQQMQYQQYVQQQEKMQQNSNYQNHPLVNFFNSYSLFINDTANIQLDQEIVLNKLIENAKKCKPPSKY